MEPSADLQKLTIRLARAVGTGDVAFLEHHASRQRGIAFLATDPDEWWTDLASLSQAVVTQRAAGVESIPGEPLVYTEGEVGWAVDRGLCFRVCEVETPFRMSVVYRRQDGKWKMVQFHSSLRVANQEAIGLEPAT